MTRYLDRNGRYVDAQTYHALGYALATDLAQSFPFWSGARRRWRKIAAEHGQALRALAAARDARAPGLR